jgi:hypothetical protein
MAFSFDAMAALSTGALGFFNPMSDIVLDVTAGGVFDFTGISINPGVTVTFTGASLDVSFLSLGDISIAGTLNANGRNLVLNTPTSLVLAQSGTLVASNISLTSGSSMTLDGSISITGGSLVTPPNPIPVTGGQIYVVEPVPLPPAAPLLLVGLLTLGFLARSTKVNASLQA